MYVCTSLRCLYILYCHLCINVKVGRSFSVLCEELCYLFPMNILINMQHDDVFNGVVEEGCMKIYNKKLF
jgi:hypothetical protein